MSSTNGSSSSEDEIASELTPELELSLNRTLDKTINTHEETSYQDELKKIQESKKDTEEIMKENEQVLGKLGEDENDKFLRDYFGKRMYAKLSDVALHDNSSDDIDDVDEALEFEENFNMRFEQAKKDAIDPDDAEIQTHPRFVDGENREIESARRRRRRQQREEENQVDNETQERLTAIDEKYKAIAQANDGHLTNEQLSEWADEVAKIQVEIQGGAFDYHEIPPEGDALALLKDDEDEEDSNNTDEEDALAPGNAENEENDGMGEGGQRKPEKKEKSEAKRNTRGRGGHDRGFRGRGGRGGHDHGFRGRGGRGGPPHGGDRRDHGFRGRGGRGGPSRQADPYTVHRK